jgi:hypothetical protein
MVSSGSTTIELWYLGSWWTYTTLVSSSSLNLSQALALVEADSYPLQSATELAVGQEGLKPPLPLQIPQSPTRARATAAIGHLVAWSIPHAAFMWRGTPFERKGKEQACRCAVVCQRMGKEWSCIGAVAAVRYEELLETGVVSWTRDSGVSTEGIRPPLAFLFLSSWQINFLFHWPHYVLVPSVYKFGVLALFLFQFFYFGTFFWMTNVHLNPDGGSRKFQLRLSKTSKC